MKNVLLFKVTTCHWIRTVQKVFKMSVKFYSKSSRALGTCSEVLGAVNVASVPEDS